MDGSMMELLNHEPRARSESPLAPSKSTKSTKSQKVRRLSAFLSSSVPPDQLLEVSILTLPQMAKCLQNGESVDSFPLGNLLTRITGNTATASPTSTAEHSLSDLVPKILEFYHAGGVISLADFKGNAITLNTGNPERALAELQNFFGALIENKYPLLKLICEPEKPVSVEVVMSRIRFHDGRKLLDDIDEILPFIFPDGTNPKLIRKALKHCLVSKHRGTDVLNLGLPETRVSLALLRRLPPQFLKQCHQILIDLLVEYLPLGPPGTNTKKVSFCHACCRACPCWMCLDWPPGSVPHGGHDIEPPAGKLGRTCLAGAGCLSCNCKSCCSSCCCTDERFYSSWPLAVFSLALGVVPGLVCLGLNSYYFCCRGEKNGHRFIDSQLMNNIHARLVDSNGRLLISKQSISQVLEAENPAADLDNKDYYTYLQHEYKSCEPVTTQPLPLSAVDAAVRAQEQAVVFRLVEYYAKRTAE